MSLRIPLRRSSKNVAYMEEADDVSGTVDETADVTYATSSAPSPTKEKMNTSRKKANAQRNSSSPGNGLTDSDSTVHPRRESKLKSSQRDKEKPPSTRRKSVTLSTPRPTTKHSKTTPVIENSASRRKRDESMYYGETNSHLVVPAGATRPRGYTTGPRPSSYYGSSSRPPISNTRYHPTPAPLLPATSYPPPSWQAAGPVSYPIPQPTYPQDYLTPQQQSLHERFNRPSTAMGHRAPAPLDYTDAYPPEDTRGLSRRLSLGRRTRQEEDRRQMPPPPRPSSARPVSVRTSAFAPPPTERRRSIRYEDDAFEGDGGMYHDVSPPTPYEYSAPRLPRPRRPSVGAQSIVYDNGPWTAEIAGSKSRRNSYFGDAAAGYEDKIQQAASYQNDVMGGPPAPLTAESLRKASKTSSRSTRSSGSHDESWRRSHTTGTTRSSANEEDVTIRVKGGATLEYGGAKMQCRDGAEINIRQAGGGRGGSDQSSYVDADDRRTRVNQPVNHKRASSQAASYSRTTPAYDYSGGGYGYEYSTAPASGIPYPSQTHGGWL